MLSKIKSMVMNNSQIKSMTMNNPEGKSEINIDENINERKDSECPFAKASSSQKNQNSKQECPMNGKSNQQSKNNEKDNSPSSESEEETTSKGGCPFMKISNKRVNPSLGIQSQGFNQPFLSKYSYYLSSNKIDFITSKTTTPRQIFESYPIYLQHTLFYNGQDYQRVRSLEICSRFMASQKLREKGNKYYNKKQYYRSLDYYERAMSLFIWLEYHEEKQNSIDSSRIESESSELQENQENSEAQNEIKLSLSNKSTKQQSTNQQSKGMVQIRQKYKQFFIIYNDSNVKLHNGNEQTHSSDIEMRKSLLLQIYINMAAAYLNLNHFTLAEKIMKDVEEMIQMKVISQVKLRLAQSYGNKSDATLEELQKGKILMEIAIENRKSQKIFSTANQNILKSLNLHDAEIVYKNCLQKIEEKIIILKKKTQENENKIIKKMMSIHKTEMRIIEEGRIPQIEENKIFQTTELRILLRMKQKYLKIIQFYLQKKDQDQITPAKRQLQEVLRILSEIYFIEDLKIFDFAQKNEQIGDISSEKLKKRISKIKASFIEDVYNGGKFNFSVMQWAVKQIVKEEKEEKQKVKKQKAEKSGEGQQTEAMKGSSKNWHGKLAFLIMLIPLTIILANMFLL